MGKFSEKKIKIETIVRQFGSSGTLLGHWLLVDAIIARLDGHPARAALHTAADSHGISPRLASSRLRGVICYMERARAERYVEIWGEREMPSPAALIDRISEEIKAGPSH